MPGGCAFRHVEQEQSPLGASALLHMLMAQPRNLPQPPGAQAALKRDSGAECGYTPMHDRIDTVNKHRATTTRGLRLGATHRAEPCTCGV